MKPQVTKSVFGFVIILAGVFVLDFIIGLVADKMRHSLPDNGGETVTTNYVLTKATPDILILGSSRATHHYIPDTIQRRFSEFMRSEFSVYNSGRDGCNIVYYYSVLECVAERKPPKFVIMDVTGSELYVKGSPKNEEFTISMLKPYYRDIDIINRLFNEIDVFSPFKMSLATYRYNSEIIKYVNAYISEPPTLDMKGFLPLYVKMNTNESLQERKIDGTISSYRLKCFRNVIELAHRNNITIFVIHSPMYFSSIQSESLDLIKNICYTEGVPFFDFADGTFPNTPDYYADKTHLNLGGAKLYSKTVMDRIISYFREPQKAIEN
jgi:hypothetical protein